MAAPRSSAIALRAVRIDGLHGFHEGSLDFRVPIKHKPFDQSRNFEQLITFLKHPNWSEIFAAIGWIKHLLKLIDMTSFLSGTSILR
jgi:hypothetical protein